MTSGITLSRVQVTDLSVHFICQIKTACRISECFNERGPEECVTRIRNDPSEPDLVFSIPAALLENDSIPSGCNPLAVLQNP